MYESARELREALADLDNVSAMLCGVLDAIECAEEPVRIEDLSTELRAWWTTHKAADVKRRAAEEEEERRQRDTEELQRRALAKLTHDERIALGLKEG